MANRVQPLRQLGAAGPAHAGVWPGLTPMGHERGLFLSPIPWRWEGLGRQECTQGGVVITQVGTQLRARSSPPGVRGPFIARQLLTEERPGLDVHPLRLPWPELSPSWAIFCPPCRGRAQPCGTSLVLDGTLAENFFFNMFLFSVVSYTTQFTHLKGTVQCFEHIHRGVHPSLPHLVLEHFHHPPTLSYHQSTLSLRICLFWTPCEQNHRTSDLL